VSLTIVSSIAFFALAILAVLFILVGSRSGSYLSRVSQHEWVFRKPLLRRIGMVLTSIALLQALLMVANEGWGAVLLFTLLWFPFGIVLLWISGPDELRLNMAERTYQRVSGWPFRSKTRSGSWTDLWGVYIGYAGRSTYIVGLRGNRLGGRVDLGRFKVYAAAEQFAQELMSELSLARVPTPKPLIQPTVSRMKAGR